MKNKIASRATNITLLALSFCFLSCFFFLFTKSFQTSPDGESYLNIFGRENMFVGREEVGFLAYAWGLKQVFNNPEASMYVTVSFSLLLFFISLRKYLRRISLFTLSLFLFSIVTIFSNLLGVQLRAGLASFMSVALFVTAYCSPHLKYKKWVSLLFLLPVAFHYNTALSVLLSLAFIWTPVRFHKTISFLFILGTAFLLKPAFAFVINDDAYYVNYLTDEALGRVLPFSIVFYLGTVVYIVSYHALKKESLNILELWSVSGVGLLLPFIQNFYLAAKILTPFVILAFICTLKLIDLIKIPQKEIIGLLLYLISYAGFYYYAGQIHYTL
ncbi:EpsG family protein [Porphyromonas levii]|uniref:EpsG family protein n=1 Tax=Porphyromonas levii TaxID=28114 RepID=UPI001B8C8952|nr:EpsG family protein [Porphyromonas levii]MBR8702626.1 hypothetical protein [Porphyromonas levii]